MNEKFGSWLNPLSGSLGNGSSYSYSDAAFGGNDSGNLITSDGSNFVTDGGIEIIYAQ